MKLSKKRTFHLFVFIGATSWEISKQSSTLNTIHSCPAPRFCLRGWHRRRLWSSMSSRGSRYPCSRPSVPLVRGQQMIWWRRRARGFRGAASARQLATVAGTVCSFVRVCVMVLVVPRTFCFVDKPTDEGLQTETFWISEVFTCYILYMYFKLTNFLPCVCGCPVFCSFFFFFSVGLYMY